jgi:hypothetical protein
MFCDDTRFLNGLTGRFNNTQLVLLSADISDGYAAEYVNSTTSFADVPEQSLLLTHIKQELHQASGYNSP